MDPKSRLAIMSFDPGGTTGWCAASFRLGHLALIPRRGLKGFLAAEALSLTSGQLTGGESAQAFAAASLIRAGVERGEVDYVVILIEDFILRQRRKDRDLLAPVRITAKLETHNDIFWQFPVVKQQPSLAKTSMPNQRLKNYRLYRPGKPHANDAIRHAITLTRRFAMNPKFLEKVLYGTASNSNSG